MRHPWINLFCGVKCPVFFSAQSPISIYYDYYYTIALNTVFPIPIDMLFYDISILVPFRWITLSPEPQRSIKVSSEITYCSFITFHVRRKGSFGAGDISR